MDSYTVDQLRRSSTPIFNKLSNGPVQIVHRDRPTMILVLKDHYEHLQERAGKVALRGGRGSAKIVPELRADKSES